MKTLNCQEIASKEEGRIGMVNGVDYKSIICAYSVSIHSSTKDAYHRMLEVVNNNMGVGKLCFGKFHL